MSYVVTYAHFLGLFTVYELKSVRFNFHSFFSGSKYYYSLYLSDAGESFSLSIFPWGTEVKWGKGFRKERGYQSGEKSGKGDGDPDYPSKREETKERDWRHGYIYSREPTRKEICKYLKEARLFPCTLCERNSTTILLMLYETEPRELRRKRIRVTAKNWILLVLSLSLSLSLLSQLKPFPSD